MNNVSFINNVCSSVYGGGVGIMFSNIDKRLHFKGCKFNSNIAKQDMSARRPGQPSKGDYYNGDGGGIQLGYTCEMNDMEVIFEGCTFIGNKAERHGGFIKLLN